MADARMKEMHLHDGGHVYSIGNEADRKDWFDLNWEMFENELPTPE